MLAQVDKWMNFENPLSSRYEEIEANDIFDAYYCMY